MVSSRRLAVLFALGGQALALLACSHAPPSQEQKTEPIGLTDAAVAEKDPLAADASTGTPEGYTGPY
ncbi:MAG: hypothetical protein ACRELY_20190, partial [Polyangiaceae bacterium]